MNTNKSEHQQLVEELLRGIGHPLPETPQVTDDDRLVLYARLLIEEAMEFLEAAGVELHINTYGKYRINDVTSHRGPIHFKDMEFVKSYPGGDLVGIADGLGDVMVIAVGGLSLCGIKDIPLLLEIDGNNLLKLKRGHKDPKTGKFIKPKDHPRPNIEEMLKQLGWEGANEEVHVSS